MQKIDGGFLLIQAAQIAQAWTICQKKPMGIADFRTWIATHEMVARRDAKPTHKEKKYSQKELARILKIAPRRVTQSVNRLVQANLISWTQGEIQFPQIQDQGIEQTIGRGRGKVAVPRRVLRWLAAGQSASIIATTLAVFLRCISRTKSGWRGWGRFKVSWVVAEFGISFRQAKHARKQLVELGWLVPSTTPAWSERKYGKAFSVCLDWVIPTSRSACAPVAPINADPGASVAPPCLKPGTLSGSKNQEPLPGAGTGVRIEAEERPEPQEPAVPAKLPAPAPARPSAGPPWIRSSPPPTPDASRPASLDDIQPIDLTETARTLLLFDQAAKRGLIGSSENDRLRFLALGEYARKIGRANPGGLMASLIRRKAWHFATQKEEDVARRKLKSHLWAAPGSPGSPTVPSFGSIARAPTPIRPPLSEDARIAREISRALAAAGYRGDPFPQLRRIKPDWTRQRWDEAASEFSRYGSG
jgi:hypothetical protein